MRPDSPTFSSHHSTKAHVVFGTLSKNCRGVGICKVEVNRISDTEAPRCGQRVPALIRKISSGIVSLTFHRQDLTRMLLDRYFRNLEFPVPEQYAFDTDVLSALHLNEFTICAGVYPVRITAEHYTLELRHDSGESIMKSVSKEQSRRSRIRQRLVSAYLF